MYSFLKYSKCLRYLNYTSREIAFRSRNVIATPSSFITINRGYAAVASEKQITSVEQWVRRLDRDVRRSGRVSMKELQEAFNEIIRSQATSTQTLMLIRCCGHLLPDEVSETKIKFVNQIWQSLERKGIVLDISHYNALLQVYLENEYKFSPLDFLSDIRKKGIEANRVTFQRLIAAYCQQGNVMGATQILEYMKEKSMPISESVFSSLITGHSVAKDMEGALAILKLMEEATVLPTAETYCSLLCAYARIGDAAGMNTTFQLCASKGIDLSDRQLLEVIFCLCSHQHDSLVDNVISRLQRNAGYNQDAKNIILRLVSCGNDGAAIKVFRTMTPIQTVDEHPLPLGTFLIKQMVKCNRNFESILKFCTELMERKENPQALSCAIEASLEYRKPDLSLQLLSALSKIEPVSQHYYWPVIIQFGKAKDEDGIIRVLKQIMVDTKSAVSNETLREYVIQFLGGNERCIQKLKLASITVASAASATVAYHLQNNNLADASKICSIYRANYNSVAIKRGVISAFRAEQDTDSFLNIVRCIVANKGNSLDEVDDADCAGAILAGLVPHLINQTDVITTLIEGYIHYELSISEHNAEKVLLKLGSKITPQISSGIKKLLSFKAIQATEPSSAVLKDFSAAKNEALLIQAIEKAENEQKPTDSLKLQLLQVYCKSNEVSKAAQLRQELMDAKVQISSETLISLLEYCIQNENLDDALIYYNEAIKDDSSQVTSLCVVKLSMLLAHQEKYDDIVMMLERHKLSSPPKELTFNLTSSCWKLLNIVADKGDSFSTERIFESLKSNNHIMPTNVILGPLVKVHLVNNDLKAALDAFERCCTGYRSTPCKNELACKLIQSEDAASLQRLTDLSSQIHGEVNTLYDLVLSFVECGRIRQARKILETPGLRARQRRLNSACERYKNDGKIGYLENLIDATKEITYIDRSLLYYNLLGAYGRVNDYEKGLGLWTRMQEETVQPSEEFLVKLADLLKKNNQPVPFAVPEKSVVDAVANVQRSFAENSLLKSLRRAVYNKDLEMALLLKNKIQDAELQINDRSALLNLLINNGRIGEATKMGILWLEQGLRPNIRTLNILVNSLAKNGDVDSLKRIGALVDSDMKRLISFTNRLVHCMVEAGQASDVIKYLNERVAKAKTPDEISEIRDSFPRGGIFSVLDKSQDLVKQFEDLEPKYREKGILDPANVLWVHYLLENNSAKLKTIWNHIKGLDRIMFKPVLKKARAELNIDYINNLLDNLKDSNISKNAVGAIHSCALDILLNQQKLDECESRLEEVLKNVPLDYLNYNTLKRLKTGLENEGKAFKYEIPIKVKETKPQSSSSSDSDDERRK